MSKFLASCAILVIGGLGSAANAQSSYNSRCGWADGVYSCNSTFETPYSVTSTLCASGGVDSACTSKTEEKKPYHPPPGGRLIIVPK